MDPNLGLLAASGLASFLLKTIAEWMVCLVLVRVAGSARIRFNLWLTLVLGFVAQWMWMWVGIVRGAFPASTILHASALVGSGAADRAGAESTRIQVAAASAGNVARAMGVLLICYGAILAWRMMGTAAARFRFARAMRHKAAPQQRLVATFQEALEQAAAPGKSLRDCELWVLPGLVSPATVGWWQPRVIVPPMCETQDASELKAVFWHELKHVERRDALCNAVMRACRILLWFHPCLHHANLRLNAERELACDAAVVREHPQIRDVYATCLVRFARIRDRSTDASVPGIEMASGAALLSTRVRSILSETQRVSRISRAMRAAVSMLLMGAMAAALPMLNVLFAAEVRSAEIGVRLAIAADIPPAGPIRAAKSAGVPVQGAVTQVVGGMVEPSGLTAAALQHDESLAAEHRAAMGILTESTGMDAPGIGVEGEGRVSKGVSRPVPAWGRAGRSSPSWTSVAVDAAERMGPLMGDHGGDDHH